MAFQRIRIKNTNVSGKIPGADKLDVAELCVNLKDHKLFSKDADGNIFEVSGGGAQVPGGDTPPNNGNEIGDLFFDTTTNTLLYWDGTQWVPIAGDEAISLDDLADVSADGATGGQILIYDDGSDEWVAENLELVYVPASDKGTITNNAGENVDLPLVDATNAGLMSPEDYAKLEEMPGFIAGPTPPGTPGLGDIWIDTSDCPPTINIWDDCDDPGNPEWKPIGGGGSGSCLQGPVSIVSSNGTELGSTLTAVGGNGVDDSTSLAATYAWTGAKTGTGNSIEADVEGDYTVTATITCVDGSKLSDTAVWTVSDSYVDMLNNTPPVIAVVGEGIDGAYEGNSIYVVTNATVTNGINPAIVDTQWFKDDVADGTGTIYVIGADDEGAVITAKQLFRDARNNELLSDASNGITIVERPAGAITFNAVITDDGTPQGNAVGSVLTAAAINIVGGTAPIEYAYKWMVDNLTMGEQKTLNIINTFIGKTVSCEVTVAEPDGSRAETRTAIYGKPIVAGIEIKKPAVLSPADGAGIGGDINYYAKTSAITVVNDGVTTDLTFTNDKAFDSATGDEVGTLSSEFKAGDKVVGEGDATLFADTPAFSTTLYTGQGGNKSVTTGIDNTEKALVWIKDRTAVNYHQLYDTLRGVQKVLWSNDASAQRDSPTGLTAFNNDGFTVGVDGAVNQSGNDYVAWNFAAAEGFFDVVTYTGTGSPQVVPHSLGSTPGFTIIKTTSSVGSWYCLHKDLSKYLLLQENSATDSTGDKSNIATVDSDNITVTGGANVNSVENVAYLFADNPDGGIKCDSYTGTGSNQTIDLGFKPVWVIIKSATNATGWLIFDSERSNNNPDYRSHIEANQANPEDISNNWVTFTDTGFTVTVNVSTTNVEYVYIAIAEGASAGQFMPEGVLTEDAAGTSMTLTDVKGTWAAGLTAVNQTEATKTAPGADDIVFTSDKPATTSGTVNSWGAAEWELSVDSGFVDKQESSVQLQDVDVEQGPINFTLEGDTEYWVRTRYNSNDPAADPSDWSDANKFKTAGGTGGPGWFSGTVPAGFFGRSSAYGKGKYVAINSFPQTYNEISLHSDDGIDWINDGVNANNMPLNTLYTACAFGQNNFVAVGGNTNAGYSSDGINWTATSISAGNWNDVIYADGKFVAIGTNVSAVSTDDGLTWSSAGSTGLDTIPWNSVAYGNGRYLAVSNNGYFATSSDGLSWTAVNTGIQNCYGVAFGNGVFVVSGNGMAHVSANGSTGWQSWATAGVAGLGIAFGNGLFTIMAQTGTNRIAYSSDGETWSPVGVPEQLYNNIDFVNDKFVVVGSSCVIYSYTGTGDPARSLFYDENAGRAVNDIELERRYGVDALDTDLRKFGIFPLTEQPTYAVDTYVKEGDAYNPVRDYTSEINAANAKVADLQSRLASLEADEVNDDATDTLLINTVANLIERIETLEEGS